MSLNQAVDIESDDEFHDASAAQPNVRNAATTAASAQAATNAANGDDQAADSSATANLTVPALEPSTSNPIWSLPELHDRYVGMYSSIEEVTYRDASQFSLKPPCWEAWSPDDYQKTAEYLERVKLQPLARQLGKPVEEIHYVLQALVTGPLYDFQLASTRGARGIRNTFELYNKYGAPMRSWGKEKIIAEFAGVQERKVQLIDQRGFKHSINKKDLTEDDLEWLEDEQYPAPKEKQDFRLWTEECIRGAFSDVAAGKVSITTEEGRSIDLQRKDLNDDDKSWLKKNVSRALLRELLGPQLLDDNSKGSKAEVHKYLGIKPLEDRAVAEGEIYKYRRWTTRHAIAKLHYVSPGAIHLARGDGNKLKVYPLTGADKDLFNEQLKLEPQFRKKFRNPAPAQHPPAQAQNTQPRLAEQPNVQTPTSQAPPAPTSQVADRTPAVIDPAPASEAALPTTTILSPSSAPMPATPTPYTGPLTPAPTGKMVRLQYGPKHTDLTSDGKRKRGGEDQLSPDPDQRPPKVARNLKDALEAGRLNTPSRSMTPALGFATAQAARAPSDQAEQPAVPSGEQQISTTAKKNKERRWGVARIAGQLIAIWRSNLRVRTKGGTEKELHVDDLTTDDREWLQETLKDDKLELLFGEVSK